MERNKVLVMLSKTLVKYISIVPIVAILLVYISVADIAIPEEVYSVTEFPFGGIMPEHSVISDIDIDEEGIIGEIDILFATYGRENNSSLSIYLTKNGEEVYRKEISDVSNLEDNSYMYLKDIDLSVAPDDDLLLYIVSLDATGDNCVTVWMMNEDESSEVYEYNTVTNESNLIDGQLCMNISMNTQLVVELNDNLDLGHNDLFIYCVLGVFSTLSLVLLIEMIGEARKDS